MPPTRGISSKEHDRDQPPAWVTLACMFVGQRLDKRAAIGAYVAAVATLAVSMIVLLSSHH